MKLAPVIFVSLLAFGSAASAQQTGAAVKPGDPAPKLVVAEWVKGKPIPKLEKGKVYLVEYWATWCGPCIGNIPHLNALQKEHGKDGLVVIGMSMPDVEAGSTSGRKENNTLQQVRDFVAKEGDRMDYHVAYDTPERTTHKAMMGKIGGIPHAFLFGRDGKLLLDGHPYYLGDAIEKALTEKWTPEKHVAEFARLRGMYREASNAKTYPEYLKAYTALKADFPIMAQQMTDDRFSQALKGTQIPDAVAAGEDMIAKARKLRDGDPLGRAALSNVRSLTTLLNSPFANFVPADQSKQLLELFGRMADTAMEVEPGKYEALAVKAELAMQSGNAARAAELQKEALALAPQYSKEAEQKRADEYAAVVQREERMRQFREQQQKAAAPAAT